MGKWQHFCRVRSISGNRGLLRSKEEAAAKNLAAFRFFSERVNRQPVDKYVLFIIFFLPGKS